MFDSAQNTLGHDYTRPVAWLAFGLIFIPGALLAVRPGHALLSLAFLCSAICLTMAWISWKKSRVAISSTTPSKAAAK